MGTIWIREFTGGLDARRLPETTSGGILIEGNDGHITRGGEFETRAAFVDAYDVSGTVGLARTRTGLVVFGHLADPGVPTGVDYQRLVHPTDGAIALLDVPSFDLYSGKIYAVGVFADGSTHHYYDGVRVADWFDGRARATFRVTAGGFSPAVAAEGSFTITGGATGDITSVTVDGITITSGAVTHTGDNTDTADAVAANITAFTSAPNYSAFADGPTVYIVAAVPGPGPNGFVVAANVSGDATVGSIFNMAGGAISGTSVLTSITVGGVEIMLSEIEWSTNNATTAQLIADAINISVSNPEYTALADGDRVVILAENAGDDINDAPVAFTTQFGFGITPASGVVMAGGADLAEGTFQPGQIVKTIDAKMNSLSGPNWHFSGIKAPTEWTTDATGAGFIDVSTYASGSEDLSAMAQYQNFVALFSPRNIQVWFIDPDPALYRKTQILRNTGTFAPHSVTEFGDADLFYLDESGIRSLRARDSSNAAAANDLGVPVDTLIQAQADALSPTERARIVGLIEPRDGRFWLCLKDKIFVYTFFPGAKVSAWSTYDPTSNGEPFEIERALVHDGKVYLRSTDARIFVYGGLSGGLVYDETMAVARLPYLDADSPTQKKMFTGIDVACQGEWTVYASFDPTNTDARDKIATVTKTTFGLGDIAGMGETSHVSLTFISQGGYARLGSAVIHYEGGSVEG